MVYYITCVILCTYAIWHMLCYVIRRMLYDIGYVIWHMLCYVIQHMLNVMLYNINYVIEHMLYDICYVI